MFITTALLVNVLMKYGKRILWGVLSLSCDIAYKISCQNKIFNLDTRALSSFEDFPERKLYKNRFNIAGRKNMSTCKCSG